MPSMNQWLNRASDMVSLGKSKAALRFLTDGLSDQNPRIGPHRAAEELASGIAASSDGRVRRRAEWLAGAHASIASQVGGAERLAEERAQEADRASKQRTARNERAKLHAALADQVGVFMTISLGEPASDHLEARLKGWAPALDVSFQIGLDVVVCVGVIAVSEVERVELNQLLSQIVNSVVLDNVAAVRDVGALRRATAACLGFALSNDDLVARELMGRVQHHAGQAMEMPSEAAVSTVVLDALEAANPPREERDLFRAASSAAFYVGLGAGLNDSLGSR